MLAPIPTKNIAIPQKGEKARPVWGIPDPFSQSKRGGKKESVSDQQSPKFLNYLLICSSAWNKELYHTTCQPGPNTVRKKLLHLT